LAAAGYSFDCLITTESSPDCGVPILIIRALDVPAGETIEESEKLHDALFDLLVEGHVFGAMTISPGGSKRFRELASEDEPALWRSAAAVKIPKASLGLDLILGQPVRSQLLPAFEHISKWLRDLEETRASSAMVRVQRDSQVAAGSLAKVRAELSRSIESHEKWRKSIETIASPQKLLGDALLNAPKLDLQRLAVIWKTFDKNSTATFWPNVAAWPSDTASPHTSPREPLAVDSASESDEFCNVAQNSVVASAYSLAA